MVARIAGVGDFHLIAIDADFAAVHLIGARKHFDQCGFPGPVVAQQAHNFARMQIDAHMVDRLDAAEGNRDVFHLDQWGCALGAEFFCSRHYFAPTRLR